MAREKRRTEDSLLAGAVLLLAPVCCLGIPLLVAGGLTVGLAAAVGGLAAGGIALAAAIPLLAARARRRRACQSPRSRPTKLRIEKR